MCLESRWNNCMFRGFVQKVEKSLIHNRFVWKCNFGSSLGTETVCWATVLCCSSCEGDVKNRRHNLYYKATSSYRVNVNQLDLRTKSETQHLPLNTCRNVLVCGTNKRILIWNDTQLLFSTLVIILWSLTINKHWFIPYSCLVRTNYISQKPSAPRVSTDVAVTTAGKKVCILRQMLAKRTSRESVEGS